LAQAPGLKLPSSSHTCSYVPHFTRPVTMASVLHRALPFVLVFLSHSATADDAMAEEVVDVRDSHSLIQSHARINLTDAISKVHRQGDDVAVHAKISPEEKVTVLRWFVEFDEKKQVTVDSLPGWCDKLKDDFNLMNMLPTIHAFGNKADRVFKDMGQAHPEQDSPERVCYKLTGKSIRTAWWMEYEKSRWEFMDARRQGKYPDMSVACRKFLEKMLHALDCMKFSTEYYRHEGTVQAWEKDIQWVLGRGEDNDDPHDALSNALNQQYKYQKVRKVCEGVHPLRRRETNPYKRDLESVKASDTTTEDEFSDHSSFRSDTMSSGAPDDDTSSLDSFETMTTGDGDRGSIDPLDSGSADDFRLDMEQEDSIADCAVEVQQSGMQHTSEQMMVLLSIRKHGKAACDGHGASDTAEDLKRALDEQTGDTWQVSVGTDFNAFVSAAKSMWIHVKVGPLHYFAYQTV